MGGWLVLVGVWVRCVVGGGGCGIGVDWCGVWWVVVVGGWFMFVLFLLCVVLGGGLFFFCGCCGVWVFLLGGGGGMLGFGVGFGVGGCGLMGGILSGVDIGKEASLCSFGRLDRGTVSL